MIILNSNELRAQMVRRSYTMTRLINELNRRGIIIARSSLYRKLNGKTEFTRKEIAAISEILRMSTETIMEIFFSTEVA